MLNSRPDKSDCVYKTEENLDFFSTYLDFSYFVFYVLWLIEGLFQNCVPVTKIEAPFSLLTQLGVKIVPSVKESITPHSIK